VIVTGGCRGIGRGIAQRFAEAGADVLVCCRNEPESLPDGVAFVAADVREPDQIDAVLTDCRARFGRVDVLINNAGRTDATPWGDLDDIPDSAWDEVMDVNVRGAFRCTRALAPALRAAGGVVVNIASTAGHRASGSSLVYSVSKAALLSLTQSLARTLAPQVRVHSVSPGTVATRWMVGLHGSEEAFQARAAVERKGVPLQATAGPEHVAQAVLGLIGMDLATGQDVVVDGGKILLY
jgi:NAD(P)-dependent dehydrogenase (short-subunit alcohol dehydrogenase family)